MYGRSPTATFARYINECAVNITRRVDRGRARAQPSVLIGNRQLILIPYENGALTAKYAVKNQYKDP